MDAVAVSKLIGSEGFGGGGGGGVGVCESESVSIVAGPSSINRCSSFLSQKDGIVAVYTSESAFWNKMPDTEHCRHTNQLSSIHCQDAPEELKVGSRNSLTLSMPRVEGKQIQRKSGKVARARSSVSSKRSRMAHMEEVSINESEVDDVKEKTQMGKQKNGLHSKRVDKRNGKVPMKSKYESFSLKSGLVSFNSATGGNNCLGIYGLKPDTHDVTKHLDELSVNELLDGRYKCPSFAKDKGKKAANLNESVLHSVRKACSILQLRKPLQTQNFTDNNDSYSPKVSTYPLSSDSCVASRTEADKGDTCTTDMTSYDKVQDSSSKQKTPANVLDFPLYQPKDILERLALLPPKDLDSLLLETVRPAVLAKNNSDLRGKPISHRVGLQPFPWSHNNSGGHCKSNADAVKLSASRTACQGRCVKIGNTATYMEGRAGFLVDVESLSYDHSLVPFRGLKSAPSENVIDPCTSVNLPVCEWGSPSSAACSIASHPPPESGGCVKCEGDDMESPRSLAAAQTLCDIATHSLKLELHEMIRCPKKSSEKTMKACKSKSNNKPEVILAAPKSVILTDDRLKYADEKLPLKKPKLLINEKSKDLAHCISVRKGPVNWSMPRSSRSSPSKSFRDNIAEAKTFNSSGKQSFLMPPPPVKFLDNPLHGKLKLRKLGPMEWNREGAKLD